MVKLVIEIEFGNDAMQLYAEALGTIREICALRPTPMEGDGGIFRDVNGNRVGKWQVITAPHQGGV